VVQRLSLQLATISGAGQPEGLVRVYLSADSNGIVESFHGELRDECLNREWLVNRREAMIVIEDWRQFYNTQRPHSALGYKTPAAMAAQMNL
jgi:transposase InsO family protein